MGKAYPADRFEELSEGIVADAQKEWEETHFRDLLRSPRELWKANELRARLWYEVGRKAGLEEAEAAE